MSFFKYTSFYFQAATKYQVHSPFVYDFVENVLEDSRQYYFFSTIEQYRRILLSDKTVIDNKKLSIKALTRKLAVSKTMGQLLFKLVHHYKPADVLLVGVFPGIAALYQATPSYKMPVIGLESNGAIAAKLSHYFQEIGVPNIQLKYGDITALAQEKINKNKVFSYVYLKEIPSKSTLIDIVRACTKDSIIVLEQPYQNESTQQTWQWLKSNSSITISIDLYHLGILFFREEQKEKVDYQLIKSILKPWAMF